MSKESRKRTAARKWLRMNKKMSVVESVREEKRIKNSLTNYGVAEFKFVEGITRIVSNSSLDNEELNEFDGFLNLIGSDAHMDEYDGNLNNLGFADIKERFASKKEYHLEEDKVRSKQKQRVKNDSYRIVKIDTPEEASKYANYTSWCVTTSEHMYGQYTGNGIGRFFFCLKDGFENVPKTSGPDAPLDEYGLSMIAVSVGIDGSSHTITCRWNHDCNGNDSVMSVEQLEDLLGMSFYEAFPPFTKEELHAKGKYMLEEIKDEMNNGGKKPQELGCFFMEDKSASNRFKVISMYGRRNAYDTKENKVMFDVWFAKLEITENGMAIGERYGDSNIFSLTGDNGRKVCEPLIENGKYIFKDYSEGCVVVQNPKDNKMHYLDLDTLELIKPNDCPEDEWFKECQAMRGGFGIVAGWDEKGRIVWNLLYKDGHWAKPFSDFEDENDEETTEQATAKATL